MQLDTNPMTVFNAWYQEELDQSSLSIPSAVCLSTKGMDGYPNARFVSFKEIIDRSFVITGPLRSRKGKEISQHNQVALTFWWSATERQVRIQGIANELSPELADGYFKKRSRASQVISTISQQGSEIKDLTSLESTFQERLINSEHINRPEQWGGFTIEPKRIEFMQFKASRFHERWLYEYQEQQWLKKQLQP